MNNTNVRHFLMAPDYSWVEVPEVIYDRCPEPWINNKMRKTTGLDGSVFYDVAVCNVGPRDLSDLFALVQ